MDQIHDARQLPSPDIRLDDPHRHLRRCTNLSYLLIHLKLVVRDYWDEFPVTEYLTKSQLFGPPGQNQE